MYKIKYSLENAKVINKLVNISNKKIINKIGIKSDWIEFEILDNDPFVPSQYLNEDELFTWYSILETLK